MSPVGVEQKETIFLSPDTKTELIKTEVENVYLDKYSKMKYYATEDGRLVKLANPTNGLPLTKREDGRYESQNEIFVLDEERAQMIPQFIPDDTLEPAHVEGDVIIGDITGRRFPINKYGHVVLPFDQIDIDPNVSSEEMTEYFEKRKKRQFEATQEEIDEQLRRDAQYNEQALEIRRREMRDRTLSRILNNIEEVDAIKSRIKDGKILETDFNRLLDIAKFGEKERKMLTDYFTASGSIIHNVQPNMQPNVQPTQSEAVQNAFNK